MFAESDVKGRIVIKSPDTDALVFCVHYFSKLQHTQELWFQTGTVSSTKDRRRNIPVHAICSTLSPVFTNILPAAHAVTSCDTTLLLLGTGKRSVFKVLKENPDNFKDLSNLAGCDVDMSLTAARRLVIKLYDSRGKIKVESKCSDSVQTMFRLFRQCSDSVQSMFRMFRICSEFSVNVQNVQTVSEFLAQNLVYSEFLDFVVGEATNTNFIIFALTRSRFEPTIYRTRGEHANTNTTDAVTNEGL